MNIGMLIVLEAIALILGGVIGWVMSREKMYREIRQINEMFDDESYIRSRPEEFRIEDDGTVWELMGPAGWVEDVEETEGEKDDI